ncbi:MAG: DUF4290 domain-containing protein [Bacteroidales bacterium]|nr:DUF4290 domain-containing protein [Bacteroidales bacterium]MBR6246314.1 DUF4290 domain-containing protein [Bacteroidales bacterium]
MEQRDNVVLEYNTERQTLKMPEYGRNVLKMVKMMKAEQDRAVRTRQAAGIVRVMELLNPQIHAEENWEQRLWDHLYAMADYDLDVDSPYPAPHPEHLTTRPDVIPLKKSRIKATHYGRNIESIIDLIAALEDGEKKTEMIRQLAIYMRQQYLIWNKDNVADETIFQDIEKLSDYRIRVPEGISLSRIAADANFSRPGIKRDMEFRREGRNFQGRKFQGGGFRKNFKNR